MKSRCIVMGFGISWDVFWANLERPLLSSPGCVAFVPIEMQTYFDSPCNICHAHEEITNNALVIPNQNVNRRIEALVSEMSNCNFRVLGLHIILPWSSPKVAVEE
jgi:hypothetical protein